MSHILSGAPASAGRTTLGASRDMLTPSTTVVTLRYFDIPEERLESLTRLGLVAAGVSDACLGPPRAGFSRRSRHAHGMHHAVRAPARLGANIDMNTIITLQVDRCVSNHGLSLSLSRVYKSKGRQHACSN